MLFSVFSVSADSFNWQEIDEILTMVAEMNIAGYDVSNFSAAETNIGYPEVEGSCAPDEILCRYVDKSGVSHSSTWTDGVWTGASASDIYGLGYNRFAKYVTYDMSFSKITQGSKVDMTLGFYMYPVNDIEPTVTIKYLYSGSYLDITDYFSVSKQSNNITVYSYSSESCPISLDNLYVVTDFSSFENGYKELSTHYLLAAALIDSYNDAEVQKGILETIGDIFEKIGNLPVLIGDSIGEMLKGLFVPNSDKIVELITDFTDDTSEDLGFISQSYSLVFNTLADLVKINNNSTGTIHFPGVKLPLNGETYTLIAEQDVKIDPFVGSDFDAIRYVRMLTSIIATLGVVNWAWKDFENLVSIKTTNEGE